MDMHARRARDRFVPPILFRVRGRIVDNPALHPQPRVRATEVNRGHATIIGPPGVTLIDIDQAARLQLTNRLPGAASRCASDSGS
jgi:hypothetical protein